jgi:four helix bundle protein
MTRTIPQPRPVGGPDPVAYLDCERLDCYLVAVEFHSIAARMVSNRSLGTALRDQLDRASVSIVLNIAEGAGRRTAPDKGHFFTMARGSATECAAILDLVVARGLITTPGHRHGRGLLVRIVQMLTRLIPRLPQNGPAGPTSSANLVPIRQPRRKRDAGSSMTHLELVAVVVYDYDPAIRFFVDVLGFELVEDSAATTNDGHPKRWVVVRPPDAQTGLLLARADGERQAAVVGDQHAGRVGFFLRVDDFAAHYERMVAAGVEFVSEPRVEPYGSVAIFCDIAGNRWDLLGPA